MESRIFIKVEKRSHWILEGLVDFGLAAQKKRGTESYLGFRFQEGGWGSLVEELYSELFQPELCLQGLTSVRARGCIYLANLGI